MKKNIKRITLGIFALLLAYLLFFPVKIDPVAWQPAPCPELTGQYKKNDQLKGIEHRFDGRCPHCEDIALDSLGNIYGAAEDGRILKFGTKGRYSELANTSGRPLGIHFDAAGNLLVADSPKGLLSISPEGDITPLSTEHGGRPYAFADDLEIDTAGNIYFSDASDKYEVKEFKYDLLEHRPNGRLLVYEPATQSTNLLMDSLYFANGIAVSHENDFVLVNETGTYRVLRYWIAGEKKGTHDVFIDNLPGFPDGISKGNDGIFWLTLISPRKKALDGVSPYPFIRKMLVRLPSPLQPKAGNWSFILGLDRNGNIVHNLQDPDGDYSQISSVQQFGDKLYFGSLAEDAVGVIDIPK